MITIGETAFDEMGYDTFRRAIENARLNGDPVRIVLAFVINGKSISLDRTAEETLQRARYQPFTNVIRPKSMALHDQVAVYNEALNQARH